MTDLAPHRQKLDPIIRLLGSDSDGEVLAAARALGRVLISANATFHDLAAAIATPNGDNGDEPFGHGEEYWSSRPRKRSFDNDFQAPQGRRRPPPKVSGPPLWETMNKALRLAWLDRIVAWEGLTVEQRTMAAEIRSQAYSQPHKALKPAQAAATNTLFGAAWVRDLRPIADVSPGDPRTPLRWTGENKQLVRRVLVQALSLFPHQDRLWVESAVARLTGSSKAFDNASHPDLERIERLLVFAYDVGARP